MTICIEIKKCNRRFSALFVAALWSALLAGLAPAVAQSSLDEIDPASLTAAQRQAVLNAAVERERAVQELRAEAARLERRFAAAERARDTARAYAEGFETVNRRLFLIGEEMLADYRAARLGAARASGYRARVAETAAEEPDRPGFPPPDDPAAAPQTAQNNVREDFPAPSRMDASDTARLIARLQDLSRQFVLAQMRIREFSGSTQAFQEEVRLLMEAAAMGDEMNDGAVAALEAILASFETDVGAPMKALAFEPVTGLARVRLQNRALALEDALYEHEFYVETALRRLQEAAAAPAGDAVEAGMQADGNKPL